MTLMGVHSVGRARKENSGYEGPWTSTPGVFDNSYYSSQLLNGWEPVKVGPGKHQWNVSNAVKPEKLMMLNTDICLGWNLNKPLQACTAKYEYSKTS